MAEIRIPTASDIGLSVSGGTGYNSVSAPSIANVFGPALDKVASVADMVAEDAARSAALGAENEARKASYDLLDGYKKTTKGKAAVDGLSGLTDRLRAATESPGKSLTGVARRMYEGATKNLNLEIARAAGEHANRELDAYETGEFEKMVQLQAQALLANPNADVRADFAGWVEHRAAKLGLGDEAKKAFEQTAYGQINEAKIRGMIQAGDSTGALAFFKDAAKAGRLTAQQTATLGKMVESQNDFDRGQEIGFAVHQEFSAGTIKSQVEAEKALRERTKGMSKDATVAANAAFREYVQAQKADDETKIGTVYGQFTELEMARGPHAAYASVTKSEAFRNLPPRLLAQAQDYMQAQVQHAESRGRANRAEVEMDKATDLANIETVEAIRTNPNFVNLPRERIRALSDKLGTKLVTDLLAIQGAMKKGVETAAKRDLDPFIPAELSQAKGEIATKRRRAFSEALKHEYQAEFAKQVESGKGVDPLPEERIREIAKRLTGTIALPGTGFFGSNVSREEKPRYLLDPAQKVTMPDGTVMPAAEYARMLDEAVAAGYTEDQVLQQFTKAKRPPAASTPRIGLGTIGARQQSLLDEKKRKPE